MKNRRAITAVIVLAALFSLVFTQAYAEESGGNGEVINGADSVYYNDGETVFNNYGTVYNNSGKVYNNAGTVFNNGGTVYNNGGRVFNNAGIVYNNGGEVVSAGDGGTVYEALPSVSGDTAVEPVSETNTDKAPSEPAVDDTSSEGSVNAPDGKFRISLAGEYADFAYIEGCDRRDGDYLAGVDDEIVFTPKPGFTISGASSTTGRCSLQEDGSIVFSGAERDGMLTLGFTVDAPVFHPDFGTYGEAQTVKIIVPNGVTVYYSTDGSEPVGDSGKVYEGPITVESSTAFQIAATADGAQSSGIIFGRYLIPLFDSPHFEPVSKGYTSVKPQPVTVTNNGLDKLKISSVRLTGADAKCFVLSTEEGGRINPGQSDSSTWTIAPRDMLSPSTYHAAAEFTFDNGSTKTVDITFTVN